jgi:hypothetical protein|tara:strand:- start:339 stop:647 length:309 start_codon:yes stop_codon:yes gene_type:complete
MAFKMKGSAFKLNEVATKSTLKMKSPLEQGNMTTCPWPGCGETMREIKLQAHLEDHMDTASDVEEEYDPLQEIGISSGGGGTSSGEGGETTIKQPDIKFKDE